MAMRRMIPTAVTSGLVLVVAFAASRLTGDACAQNAGAPAAAGGGSPIKTLLLVGGTIHDWKGVGDVVEGYLKSSGRFEVTRVNNDLDAFKADRLKPYDLVVFYYTLGALGEEQKRGLMNFVAGGKGFATFHSGADSFRGDPDYRALVGGHFIGHPAYRQYQVSITEVESPITKGVEEFLVTDEQYFTDYDPRVKVLANALHRGKPWPVLWTKDWGKGRVFYSALGHDAKACQHDMFKLTFLRGAQWAAGRDVKD